MLAWQAHWPEEPFPRFLGDLNTSPCHFCKVSMEQGLFTTPASVFVLWKLLVFVIVGADFGVYLCHGQNNSPRRHSLALNLLRGKSQRTGWASTIHVCPVPATHCPRSEGKTSKGPSGRCRLLFLEPSLG